MKSVKLGERLYKNPNATIGATTLSKYKAHESEKLEKLDLDKIASLIKKSQPVPQERASSARQYRPSASLMKQIGGNKDAESSRPSSRQSMKSELQLKKFPSRKKYEKMFKET